MDSSEEFMDKMSSIPSCLERGGGDKWGGGGG